MNNNPNQALKKLFGLLNLSYVDSTKIAFQIAPIFNSVGRIDNPNKATKLLAHSDTSEEDLNELIAINRKRKSLSTNQYKKAEQEIIKNGWDNEKIIVVHGDFDHGIIGIIAARVAENFHKPSIVISQSGTGSARTVQGSNFPIINLIKHCAEYLKSYGGHDGAAGLSIDLGRIDSFREAIQIATINEPSITPIIQYTSQYDLRQFPVGIFDDLSALDPFGIGNPKPIFYCPNSQQISKFELFGTNKEHVKLTINKKKLLAFSKGNHFKNKWKSLEFLYTPNCLKEKNFLINDLRIF
jgi:single-stranded-DNA-specific exonuclease